MVKKIIFSIIALGILVVGYNSFNRLRYWDRSVQIFKINNNQTFGRGFDRGRGSFNPNFNRENTGERVGRQDFRNIPDSVRQRFTQRQMSTQSDSLRRLNGSESFPTDRNSFRGRGGFEGGERQRGGFQQRKNVRLNTVYRFLAVFAALTVLTFYIDKVFKIRRKRRKLIDIEVKK